MAGEHRAMGAVLRAGVGGKDADLQGVLLTNQIKVLLSTPGAGRAYPRGKGKVHIASAPGQPPAVDTGAYRAAWKWDVIMRGPGVIDARIYADPAQLQQYDHPDLLPEWLEFGTSRMAPRPHVRPAVHATSPLLAQVPAKGIEDRQRAEARRRGGGG